MLDGIILICRVKIKVINLFWTPVCTIGPAVQLSFSKKFSTDMKSKKLNLETSIAYNNIFFFFFSFTDLPLSFVMKCARQRSVYVQSCWVVLRDVTLASWVVRVMLFTSLVCVRCLSSSLPYSMFVCVKLLEDRIYDDRWKYNRQRTTKKYQTTKIIIYRRFYYNQINIIFIYNRLRSWSLNDTFYLFLNPIR